jgi:hypothetical protein
MTSNDALYKVIHASQPDVATILCQQEQSIQAIDKKWPGILRTFQLQQNELFTGLLNTVSAQVKTHVAIALDPISLSILLLDSMVKAVESRLGTKIDDYSQQFGDLRQDVNDHEKCLTNFSSKL